MRKPQSLPRYINPANIQIGDVIRVSWSAGGIEHTRTAKVARRDYEGQVRILSTDEGTEIMHWVPGATNARVTLLEVMPEATGTLDDLLASLDDWEKVS